MTESQFIINVANNTYNYLNSATTTKERKRYYETLKSLIENHPFLNKIYELVENAKSYTKRIIRKAAEKVMPRFRIEWNGIQPIEKNHEQLYLIRLLDKDKNLIYSKVGTTTRNTKKRMVEHLQYYAKDGVKYVEVMRLWDCGEIPAEMYESAFRAKYIKKFPNTFKKNDRFVGVEFDYDEADKLFSEFTNI